MPRRFGSTLTAYALIGLLSLVLIGPIVSIVWEGFVDSEGGFTTIWLEDVLVDTVYREQLINSVWVAVLTTLLTLIISIPLAMIAENYDFRGKRLWLILLQIPLILPPFVGALGLRGLLARSGGLVNVWLEDWGLIDAPIDFLANKFWAVVVLEALYLYPITFLNIQAALANLDPALDEAARNLGAGPWRRFWRITLPLMRPGVFAGGTIVFIWSFTELGTPLLVGYDDLAPVAVFNELQQQRRDGLTYTKVVVLLVASALLYLTGKLLVGRAGSAMVAKATLPPQPVRLSPLMTVAATLPFALVVLAAVLPHIGVILLSVSSTGTPQLEWSTMTSAHHYELWQGIVSPDLSTGQLAGQSIVNSFRYAIAATLVTVVVGFGVAYLIVRRRSTATRVLDHLAMLPLAVPGLVMAFGYLSMTLPRGAFVGFCSSIHSSIGEAVASLHPANDPTLLLIIAYATRRLPFMVRSCAAGLEQVSEALEEAALNLGASQWRTMLRITIPLLAANFLAGGLLVFSRSMLEVSDSLILAQDESDFPMTKAIWALSQIPANGVELASALGVWGMVLLAATMAGLTLILGKKAGALFRV